MDLAHHLIASGMDQFQVFDKSPGEGVLYGNDHGIHFVRIQGGEHLLKMGISRNGDGYTLIKSQGSLLVETASLS